MIKMNLAIISHNQNAYSETFIQAHRNIPGMKVSFYYDGIIPGKLEGKGSLQRISMAGRIKRKILTTLYPGDLTFAEECLLKSLKKEKIGCVLAEYGMVGTTVMKVCKKANIPLIVHFHGHDAVRQSVVKKYEISYREMFQYTSTVIAVSRVMIKKLTALGCSEEKIVYNPYGPNDLFFNVIPDFSNKLFIGIGRFVDKKAPYYTILAFHEVLKHHPDARMVIAGDGYLLETCKNIVRYLRIEKQVEFPGIISPDQFREYLGQSCAFVQHSITAADGDMEGTPVGVLEASAAGLPVISTRHAGIPDVILDWETGLLVEEHDVTGMAKNMIWVLDNPDKAEQMGEKGRNRIRSSFSMEQYLSILKKAIEKAVTTRQ